MNPKIPAAVVLAAITTEAIFDREYAQPHIEAAQIQRVVVPVTPPVPATGFTITQRS